MFLFFLEKLYCYFNLCLYGGKCIDNKNGYFCLCIGFYRGVNCEGIVLFVDVKNNFFVILIFIIGIFSYIVLINYLFIIDFCCYFVCLVFFNVFYKWMIVISVIYMLYVFKECVDVELVIKVMVLSVKRVSLVWKSILCFFLDVNLF